MREVLRFFHVAVREGDRDVFRDLSFCVRQGETLGLLGLPKDTERVTQEVLMGRALPHKGRILHMEGAPGEETGMWYGIFDIRAENMLVDNFNAAENIIVFTRSRRAHPFVRHRAVREQAQKMLDELSGGTIDAAARVSTLTRYERCVVSICRALHAGARLLVFDSIVDRFSEMDRRRFEGILAKLRGRGIALLVISNNMQIVQQLCDQITVVRGGCTIKTLERPDFSTENIVRCLTGGDETLAEGEEGPPEDGRVLLEVRDMPLPSLKNPLSLYLRRGEIVGLIDQEYALSGTLIDWIFYPGLRDGGEVLVEGAPVPPKPRAPYKCGISLLERIDQPGSLLRFRSLLENITLPAMQRSALPLGVIRRRFLHGEAQRAAALTQLAGLSDSGPLPPGIDTRVRALLARNELQFHPVLLVRNPTRWLEHRHAQLVFQYLRRYAARGNCVLFSSSDMTEIKNNSDRYYVIQGGEVREESNR